MRLERRVAGAGRAVRVTRLGLPTADERRIRRFAQDDLRVGTLTTQHARDTGHGAARAVAGYEIIEARVLEVVDDLARRRRCMDFRVRVGLELAGEKPAVRF